MKTAICFSGAIRDFETCIPSIKKYLIQNNNVDIFLHLWHTTNTSKTNIITHNFKWKYYDNDHNKLITLLKPKKYVIDTFDNTWEEKIIQEAKITKFNTKKEEDYGFNCCSMYYKIRECYKLVEEYMHENNIQYDLVIRARLDFIWEDYFTIENLDPYKLYLVKDRYATCSKLNTNDKCFAGSVSVMKKMCYIFDNLHKYQKDGIMLDGQIINEHHIKKNNLSIHWIGNLHTYYKCLPRHAINKLNVNILIHNDNINNFTTELTYRLLYAGYNVYYKNKILENDIYLEYFNNFHYFNNQINNYIEICINIDKNNITFNNNSITFTNNIYTIFRTQLIWFILSMINNNITNNNYTFTQANQITKIDNNEKIIYKYLDHGYYELNLLCDKNDYYVMMSDIKKKITRDDFKLKYIYNYYSNFTLPY